MPERPGKNDASEPWRCGERVLEMDRPRIMGILNVTPDSFADGGRYNRLDSALRRAAQMREEGADILDVGGESTRPGSAPVGADEECRRVIPVVREIAKRHEVAVSVDTMKAVVARRAIEAGACIVNDVSAATHDPEMLPVVADAGAGLVLMHMRGAPATMQNAPRYADVRREVCQALNERVRAALSAGVRPESLAVDPGIGFGKTLEHNLELLAFLEDLRADVPRIVVGASRKRFLKPLTGREVDDRLAGTLAVVVWCALHGANVIRVHDVKEACDALKVAVALKKMREQRLFSAVTEKGQTRVELSATPIE